MSAITTCEIGNAHQIPSTPKLVFCDKTYASGNSKTHCEINVRIIAVIILPEARKTPVMQSCSPINPQAKHVIFKNLDPLAMTSGSLGTKNLIR